jgi:hypothetical protein
MARHHTTRGRSGTVPSVMELRYGTDLQGRPTIAVAMGKN